jgi:hypothetical protein
MKSTSTTPKVPPPRLDTDGPIKLSPATLIPFHFLKKQNESQKNHRWNLWKRGIPDSHIYDFIQYGLTTFLDSYGYSIGMTIRDAVSYCKHWAFAHVEKESNYQPIQEINLLRCAHNGGQDEIDWYFHTIPSEDWFILYENWQTFQFLDNSDAGHAQRTDLPFFAWKLIHLNSSKAHIIYLDFMNSDEELYDDNNYNQFTHTNNEETYGKGYM